VGFTDKNWDDVFKDSEGSKFAIIMHPRIPRITDTTGACKCGVTSAYQCPEHIKDGKCTTQNIQKLVVKVLFPKEYGNQK